MRVVLDGLVDGDRDVALRHKLAMKALNLRAQLLVVKDERTDGGLAAEDPKSSTDQLVELREGGEVAGDRNDGDSRTIISLAKHAADGQRVQPN